jgi:tRNA(Leu) C34 or U34 (ribose-2'-O)-methylase TrmL
MYSLCAVIQKVALEQSHCVSTDVTTYKKRRSSREGQASCAKAHARFHKSIRRFISTWLNPIYSFVSRFRGANKLGKKQNDKSGTALIFGSKTEITYLTIDLM